jgi:uncharacterized glyoxalase superfamily protein PhnB
MAVTSRLNPYLSFSDNARQALEFYRGVFGGELVLSTFGEAGGAEGPDADKIMHGQLETPAGYTLMAADTPAGMERAPGRARVRPAAARPPMAAARAPCSVSGRSASTAALPARAWRVSTTRRGCTGRVRHRREVVSRCALDRRDWTACPGTMRSVTCR